MEKICISRLPAGVTESAVRLECARHGAVTSLILEADGTAAYVTFASAAMAATAVQRMPARLGVLGTGPEPIQVRLISEIPENVRLAAALPGPVPEEPMDPSELPEYLRPREERKRKRSKSRRKRRSRSRKRRQRSRSMVRWLDRSRSNSHTATGQYIRATGYSSTVRWWEKKRESSDSSSSSSRGRKKKKEEEPSLRRPRQVAVRGHWAQFVHNGASYFYNVLTGQTVWDRPADFDAGPSRRPWEVAAQGASTALPAITGGRPGVARPTGALL